MFVIQLEHIRFCFDCLCNFFIITNVICYYLHLWRKFFINNLLLFCSLILWNFTVVNICKLHIYLKNLFIFKMLNVLALVCNCIVCFWYGFINCFIDAHCERLPDDPAQGLLFETESESKFIPFFENVTVACHEVGRPLRSTLTAGFRQCAYDPREGLPQQHWLSGARPMCPSMF